MTRTDPIPSTPARIAARPEVIAVFVYVVLGNGSPAHGLIEAHGVNYHQWLSASADFAAACDHAGVDDSASMRCGDAQVLRYMRRDKHAIVVVTPAATKFSKSARRAMRVALDHVDCEARRSTARKVAA
jgi:hypothetical protein